MIPQALVDAAVDEKLVIFVGAGFSRTLGIPDWKKMVSDILYENKEYIDKSQAYINALSEEIMTPLDVLDKVKSDRKLILQGFEKKTNLQNYESKPHRLLGDISKKIITTNFDKVIESNLNFKTVITQTSNYNLSKIDTENEFLLKIHGDISQADSCIIFTEQFEKLYNEDKLAQFQLKKLLSSHSFLFLGFSFNDPYVTNLFNFISDTFDGFGPKHFIISIEDKKIDNLETIIINDYNELNDILKSLAKSKTKKAAKIENSTPLSPARYSRIELDGSDIPPFVPGWVGREKELSHLKADLFKVIFITGLGGEGKSSLASHFLSAMKDENEHIIYDWRDFKEQDQKFHQKIISMIRIVSSNFERNELIGLSEDELIAIFFNRLESKKAVFILDNVDSYIDLEKFEPINGIGKLVNNAMKYEHNAKFIFTCRPVIHFANVNFYQMSLNGLTQQNTIDFFRLSNLPLSETKINSYAIKAHSLTNGHALWLSLIVAQAKRGEEKLANFLDSIESTHNIGSNDSTFLSEKVLNSIWSLLNERDQKLLKTLAESVRPEAADDYAEILRDEFNYNKFNKSLTALKNLNLIISKINTTYIELHPLVKEYVRKNYQGTDRKQYIYLLVKFYDKLILIAKDKLSHKLSFEELSNFTRKAELSINAGEYQEAINSLREVHSSMNGAGYTEEYLRVSKFLFKSFSWSKNKISSLENFDEYINVTCQTAIEYGDFSFNQQILEKYESNVEGKGEQYIRLCRIKAFNKWVQEDFNTAINICEEALYLLKRSGLDDTLDIGHDLALALRDSKIPENIDKALERFILNNEIDTLTDKSTSVNIDQRGAMYGNVGNCLFLKGDTEKALICYYKSFYCIYIDANAQRLINIGLASKWIFESLISLKMYEPAFYFCAYALITWKESSPLYYNRFLNSAFYLNYKNDHLHSSIISKEPWRVEEYCIEFIMSEIPVKM